MLHTPERPDSADEEIAFAGVARQAALVRDGAVSSRELTELALRRIERLDPQLNAFRVVWAERALAAADQADARRRGGDDRPLLGVPVDVKDCFDVAGEVTASGTGAAGAPARADAELVRRLRAAGAIVVGKTLTPELCAWPFTESMTWGVTRNPWSLERSPGGSSGGAGAAVAAGLVGASIGSDGAGSIRIPSWCCGLFGLKPQRGRVSLMPRAEEWNGLSTAGPLTRGVLDAALVYDAIRGGAPGDRVAAPEPARSFAEAAATPPGRLRIAVSHKIPPGWPWARLHDDARRATDEMAGVLRGLGHELVARDPDYGLISNEIGVRYLHGLAETADEYAHPDRLERRSRLIARLGGLVPERLLAWARAQETISAARIGRLFDDVDVLLTPGLAQPPLEIGRCNGRGPIGTLLTAIALTPYTAVWNVTGQPAAAVPAGFTSEGLPLGVQLVGRPNDEPTLLSLAAQLEAERDWTAHRPPLV